MASSLELNKIAAAVLTAGVVAMGTGFLAEVLVEPEHLEEPAYMVATAEGEPGAEEPAAPAGPEPVLPLLAEASAADGEKAARACQACHSFEKGGPNKVGPALYGIMGEPIASVEGFSYSDALGSKEGEWTYEKMNAWLADPQGWAKGTKMTFAGVSSVKKRADLIAYMRQQDDDPPPLPSAEEVAAVEQEQMAAEEPAAAEEAAAQPEGPDLARLLAEASAEDGQNAVRACQACHSFEKGGPHKVGPNLYDVVGADIASAEGYSYSDALAGKDGTWTYEKLFAFLENPQGWAKGTKMTFAGIGKPEKRADILLYLRQQGESAPPLPGGAGEQAMTEPEPEPEPEAAEPEPAEAEQQAEAAPADDGVAARVAAASADDGAKAVGICKACHTFEKGGAHRVGPNLYDVVGGDIAGAEGYAYSDALANKDGTWTYADLDAWLENPREWLPGNKMTYPGVKDDGKRADIIAYMRELSESPPPLPGE